MNKNDLVTEIAKKSGLSKTDSAKATDALFSTITTSLKTGSEVRLVGFGTFSVADRKETKGRNPRTRQEIIIPASKRPKFKPGKSLKEAVNH